MPEHTPTPWQVGFGPLTSEGSYSTQIMPASGGDQVAAAFGWGNAELSTANAEFIVRAVNSHAALVAALEAIAKEEREGWPPRPMIRHYCDEALANVGGGAS